MKNKGVEGELEISRIIKRFFKKYIKNPKVKPMPGSGNIPGFKGDQANLPVFLREYLHEIKRVEKLNLGKALQQAYREAGIRYPAETGLKVPLVIHRRNNKGEESWPLHIWAVTLPLLDFYGLIKENLELRETLVGYKNKEELE